MSGLSATVLLREKCTPGLSGEVGEVLRAVAEVVQESRSSRHWEVKLGESSLSIDIEPTDPLIHDFDDLLLRLGLDYNDVPESLCVWAPRKSTTDEKNLRQLAHTLAERLDGIYLGVQ